MKPLFFCIIVIACSFYSQGQDILSTYAHEKIYPDSMQQRLTQKVDSLNNLYIKGGFQKEYYSVPQGMGNMVSLKTNNEKEIIADIKKGISYEAFVRKYPSADTATGLLLTRRWKTSVYNSFNEYYELESPDTDFVISVPMESPASTASYAVRTSYQGKEGKWIYSSLYYYWDRQQHFQAVYITQPLVSKPIPAVYAKLIRYADCLTDTSTRLYSSNPWIDELGDEHDRARRPRGEKYVAFLKYYDELTNALFVRNGMPQRLSRDWLRRDSLLLLYLKDTLSPQPLFRQRLADAAEEVLQNGAWTSHAFEYCVAHYYSPAAALALKRNRINADNSDSYWSINKIHVNDIGLLAAAVDNISLLLKCHMYTITDNSYSSPYWLSKGRYMGNCHLDQLEKLHIHISDLLLGASLSSDNSSPGYYTQSYGMLAGACGQVSDPRAVGDRMLAMIKDPRLDNYNRLLMRKQYQKLIMYLQDKADREACIQQLEAADKTLPLCIVPHAKRWQNDRQLLETGITYAH